MFNRRYLRILCIINLALAISNFSAMASTSYESSNPGSSTSQSASMTIPMSMTSSGLSINPNDYSFLVYNCGTDGHIINAMTTFGITPTYRNASLGNHVTADDLATHDILIVSWNSGGNSSGLDPDILYAGITGRVVLTGHDLDYHTGHQDVHTQYAEAMFSQAIDYVLTSSNGTGMIGLTDPSTLFDWLPSEWGITATNNTGNNIEDFTAEGVDSGIYDGLIPDDMDNWGTSYHNTFTGWGDDFAVFEFGGSSGDEAITIANIHTGNLTCPPKTDPVKVRV